MTKPTNDESTIYDLEDEVEYLRDRVLFLGSLKDMLLDAVKKVHSMRCEPRDAAIAILTRAIETEINMSLNHERDEKPT